MRIARILTCLMLIAVLTILLSRPAHAGKFATMLALTATAVETEAAPAVTPAVKPATITADATPKLITRLVSTSGPAVCDSAVCGPGGCPPAATCATGCECPIGGACPCENCPATLQPIAAPEQSVVTHRGQVFDGHVFRGPVFRGDGPLMERGPMRRACKGVARGVWRLFRDGGPIRKALRARRGG